MTILTQDTRHIAIATPFGKDVLALRSFTGKETLSELYEYQVEMYSLQENLDPQKIVGQNVTLLVDRDDRETRFINGIVSHFEHSGRGDLYSTYRATIVPWFWQLTLRKDSRIFQKKTTPEIVKQVFKELGFKWFKLKLSGNYRPRNYCVQYRESDFVFVSRLLEEEGIYYYFQHKNGRHTLVLADSPSANFELPDSEVELAAPGHTDGILDQLKTWRRSVEIRSGAVAQTDYNFKKPRNDLMTTEKSMVSLGFNEALEVYDYPGHFRNTNLGSNRTRVQMEAIEATHQVASGTSTYRSFTPGGKIKIENHRNLSEEGKQYVLLSVETRASSQGSYLLDDGEPSGPEFENTFTCIPADTPFRAELKTTKPVVEGPQTAIVVGPKGEEIFTDEHGRVKCHFHWDRLGRRNDKSSCWIRVSQIHAGKGWGTISIPRIGEEVLVSFLEGDPDRPIIKGRVFNAKTKVPFGLPGEMTRSGMKSDSHKGSGFNEMSADDTVGKEQLRTNAQFNMDTTAGNNQTLAVGVDRTEDIGNNDTLTVAVDKSAEIANDQTVTIGNNETVTVGNNIVIEAGTSITLACGASTIHMNQAGVITISGQFVTSAAAAVNSIVAPLTEVVGSTMLTQAGMACFNLGDVCHVKGKETSVGGASVNVEADGLVVVKGAPIMIGEVGMPLAKIPAPAPQSGGGGDGGGGDGGGGGGGGSESSDTTLPQVAEGGIGMEQETASLVPPGMTEEVQEPPPSDSMPEQSEQGTKELSLDDPDFWEKAQPGVYTDGDITYAVLDDSASMKPIVRTGEEHFQDTVDRESANHDVIINGNAYDLTNSGMVDAVIGSDPVPAESTLPEGMVIDRGKHVAGSSEPNRFFMAQAGGENPQYEFGKGDPPRDANSAVGGLGPIIVDGTPYGVGNQYDSNVPPGAPTTGDPGEKYAPHLTQRNNNSFAAYQERPPNTGKTIVAHSEEHDRLLVISQPDGAANGKSMNQMRDTLNQQDVDNAVFLDGSDSSLLVTDGNQHATQGSNKNETTTVGVGFSRE